MKSCNFVMFSLLVGSSSHVKYMDCEDFFKCEVVFVPCEILLVCGVFLP